MRKNGFTLVEVLTVIIILVTLGLVAVFSISGVIKNSTEKLYQVQVETIIDASRTYVLKNSSSLSDNNEITLCDLKREGLIDSKLKNPKTEQEFANNLIVKIIKNSDGEYDFTFDGESIMNNYTCDLDISVALNGNSPLYVKLGDTHQELGVTVKRKELVCSKRTGSQVTTETNCYYTLQISGNYTTALTSNKYSKVGTFTETYEVQDGIFSSTMTRTIIVEDKTPPTITVRCNNKDHTSSFEVRILETDVASLTCSAYDGQDHSVPCTVIKNDYNSTRNPGTYEIIYKATDSSGNSASLVATIIVVAKNKSLIVGLEVDKVEWTNEDVRLRIFPLYSSACSNYLYTFDGYNWGPDTLIATENGTYQAGIQCNDASGTADYMIYEVQNIDKSVPEFGNEAIIRVESETSEVAELVKEGIVHYYANGPVTLSNPSGASDTGSGIDKYLIYVNGELFEDGVLTEEGRYEIKLKALDYAGNESEIKLAAYVTISSLKPTCEFVTCSGSTCNTLEPIKSSYVEYNTKYRFTTNTFNPAVTVLYKFNCEYQYYEYEEEIYISNAISTDKIYMYEESGENTTITVNSVTPINANITSSCTSGLCTKVVPYVASINFSGFNDPATSFGNLYLSTNALCDRINNCNDTLISSMPLWLN